MLVRCRAPPHQHRSCALCSLLHGAWRSWHLHAAWLQTLQVVAIANDITHQSGAFGPLEDALFRAAGELALKERLPLIYLAANSGARVGMAMEVCVGIELECAVGLWSCVCLSRVKPYHKSHP